MADVISFDSQDFLLQSDIDLLQSVEFEFPVQEASDIKTEVTQIEIITSPTKRKRGSGSKKTQASGGAGTKKSTSAQYTTVPLPPCKVCSGVATGFHFGVITCEACKAFFRRALIHKQNYKCLKDNDCDIIDKKLGNCSACRLKKCFALGMSKGGVRRGRYSIAIRTKAIVEAKAMEGKNAAVMLPYEPQVKQEPKLELVPSPDSGISLDALDGLLDIGELNTHFSRRLPSPAHSSMASLIEVMIERNEEMESLLDALMSCQEALYPQLRKMYGQEDQLDAKHIEIYENYTMKQDLLGEMFGTTDNLSTEEYQQIFAETGIDLDDRLVHFNKKGFEMEEYISQFVNYAKIIPGFKQLNPKDVSKLLKGAHLEFWMFGVFRSMNSKLGVCGGLDSAVQGHKSVCAKFFGEDYTNSLLDFSDTLKKLAPTLEEIAIMRVILITFTDRCELLEAEKVQHLQDKFVECLQYHLTKTVANPGRRLAQIIDRMLAIRDLTHSNMAANKKFLTEWGFVMQDYPLWKEMLSFDEI